MPTSQPALYLFSGIGSGQFNNPFTDAPFVIFALGDAGAIATDPNTFGSPAQTLSIAPGTAGLIFNGQVVTFSSGLTIAALSNNGLYRVSIGLGLELLMAVSGTPLQGYGLAQSIGPVPGAGTFTQQVWLAGGQPFAINSISSATFHAILTPVSTPTPTPTPAPTPHPSPRSGPVPNHTPPQR